MLHALGTIEFVRTTCNILFTDTRSELSRLTIRLAASAPREAGDTGGSGYARIETTAIYASAIGDEERNLGRKAWSSLELAIPEHIGAMVAPTRQMRS
jgi:hypothetical protein